MAVVLAFLIPLAVLVILAFVVGVRRRGQLGASGANAISAQAARAITDARSAEHQPGGGPVGGI